MHPALLSTLKELRARHYHLKSHKQSKAKAEDVAMQCYLQRQALQKFHGCRTQFQTTLMQAGTSEEELDEMKKTIRTVLQELAEQSKNPST